MEAGSRLVEDVDFALHHRHVAGVAQPQPNGPGGCQAPTGRAVRRRGRQPGFAVPVEDSGTRYGAPSAEAVATQASFET